MTRTARLPCALALTGPGTAAAAAATAAPRPAACRQQQQQRCWCAQWRGRGSSPAEAACARPGGRQRVGRARGWRGGGHGATATCDEPSVRPGDHPAGAGCVRGTPFVPGRVFCICQVVAEQRAALTCDARRWCCSQVGFIAHLKNLQSHTIVQQVGVLSADVDNPVRQHYSGMHVALPTTRSGHPCCGFPGLACLHVSLHRHDALPAPTPSPSTLICRPCKPWAAWSTGALAPQTMTRAMVQASCCTSLGSC